LIPYNVFFKVFQVFFVFFKKKLWGDILTGEGLPLLAGLFPVPIDITKKLILDRGPNEREKFPNKSQLKNAIDDTVYKSMKDHYTFLQLLTPYTEGNPDFKVSDTLMFSLKFSKFSLYFFKDINLRSYPEVYAKVFALLVFVTTGDDAKLQDKNIRRLRTHGDVGKCTVLITVRL
jgi:hypothetical protein